MFSRHPAPGDNAADFLLQLLDRLGLSRSGPISRGATGPRYFFLAGFHVLDDDAVRFSETHKLTRVAELPTMVLLETRGLQLSSVKRGGIGCNRRLGAVAPSA